MLVVDDDEDMLVIIQHTLLAEGFNPIFSPNAYHVMDIITRNHPDLVLLDIHMKGVDGADICQEIKSNPLTASTPIIIFSANHDIEKITKECGADGYILKPFTHSKLKEAFDSLLGVGKKI